MRLTKPLLIHEDGDANQYTLLNAEGNWVMAIKMNGEMSLDTQRSILELIAKAGQCLNDVDTALATLAIGADHGITPQAAKAINDVWPFVRTLLGRHDDTYETKTMEAHAQKKPLV